MTKTKKYNSSILDDFLNEITPAEQEKKDKRMQLAARIDDGVKAKGWKKKDFAEAMNKVPSEISKWLSGTHNFNSDTLFDIEKVLNIKLIKISDKPKEQVVIYKATVNSKVKLAVENTFADYLGDFYTSLMHSKAFITTQ